METNRRRKYNQLEKLLAGDFSADVPGVGAKLPNNKPLHSTGEAVARTHTHTHMNRALTGSSSRVYYSPSAAER